MDYLDGLKIVWWLLSQCLV